VKLQAQLARRASDAQRDAALNELDQGIERATHLVAQLLQMARLEPDVRQRHPQTVRLDDLAGKVVAAFSAQAEARDIDLGLDRSDPVQVHADPAELRAMLDNLVDNALKHTAAGCRVDVRVRQRDGAVELEVSDNGPGIPKAERERVLQRFVRLNPQGSTGSGLGLAIVSQIVQNKGGQLSLHTTAGGGLTVRVRLKAHQMQ
jgi:two-component system, OmpR family, sensor kinase